MIDIKTMTILIVDDMKSMRLALRKMLRNLEIGKNFLFADNGKSGLSVLKNSSCDLLIVDWNMPEMNGSQMLDHLRRDKDIRDIPVIMVTAENERAFKRAAQLYVEILSFSTRYFDSAVRLGETLLINGFRNEARMLFSRIMSKSRSNKGLQEKIIDICLENQEYEFVAENVTETIKENPSNMDLMYKAGTIYLETGDQEKAMECFVTVDNSRRGVLKPNFRLLRFILKIDVFSRQTTV